MGGQVLGEHRAEPAADQGHAAPAVSQQPDCLVELGARQRAKLDVIPAQSSCSDRLSASGARRLRPLGCMDSGDDSRAETSDFSDCWNSA